MKDFFKYVTATIVGLFVFGIIITLLGVMSLVGMVSAGEATKTVADKYLCSICQERYKNKGKATF